MKKKCMKTGGFFGIFNFKGRSQVDPGVANAENTPYTTPNNSQNNNRTNTTPNNTTPNDTTPNNTTPKKKVQKKK